MAHAEPLRFEDVLAELGVDEIGKRYIEILERDLAIMREQDERGERAPEPDRSPIDELITMTVWSGEDENGVPLPDELRWDVTMAALHHCPTDDGLLGCLGDGPFDHFVVRPGIKERLYAARDEDPKLQELFAVMRRELPSEGVTGGWWFE